MKRVEATCARLALHERRRLVALCQATRSLRHSARLIGVTVATYDRATMGRRMRAATVARIRAALHEYAPRGPRLVVIQ